MRHVLRLEGVNLMAAFHRFAHHRNRRILVGLEQVEGIYAEGDFHCEASAQCAIFARSGIGSRTSFATPTSTTVSDGVRWGTMFFRRWVINTYWRGPGQIQ